MPLHYKSATQTLSNPRTAFGWLAALNLASWLSNYTAAAQKPECLKAPVCQVSLTLLVLQVDVSARVYQQLHTLGIADGSNKVKRTAGQDRQGEQGSAGTSKQLSVSLALPDKRLQYASPQNVYSCW